MDFVAESLEEAQFSWFGFANESIKERSCSWQDLFLIFNALVPEHVLYGGVNRSP